MRNKNAEIAILIFLLVVFCIPSSLGIFKKLIGANGLVNASQWNVSLNQDGINNNLQVIPDTLNAGYTLKVTSNSQVDVVYSIIVSNLPAGVEVKLDDGNFQTPTNNTVIFNDAGNIYYSDDTKEKTHILTFKANTGATIVNNQTVDVNVEFKQM